MAKPLIALAILTLALCPGPATSQSIQSDDTDRQGAPQAGLELWVDRNSLGGNCSDTLMREQVTRHTPWCTLFPAVTQVEPGDLVRVREGVYTETLENCHSCYDNIVLQVVTSGTSNAWIRFVAQDGENVEISGSGGATRGVWVGPTWDGILPRFIEIRGFKIRNLAVHCVHAEDTHNVIFRDLEVTGCTHQAVYFHNTSAVTLERSLVHHNPIGAFSSAVTLHECGDGHVIRGNAIWANTNEDPRESEGHGVIMDTCRESGGALIENNLIWDNEGKCITLHKSDGATVRNNTCWMNGNGRPQTPEVNVFGRNHSIHNNIIIPRNGTALKIREALEYIGHLHTIKLDGNLMWSPFSEPYGDRIVWVSRHRITVEQYRLYNDYGWGSTALQLDPLLVNPMGQNFRLNPGSPALDTADPSHAAAEDILGIPRPRDGDGDGNQLPDRGAFEMLGPEDPFFADFFESGDMSSWSQVVN